MEDNPREFCASGARCSEEYIAVDRGISLRVVSYTPEHQRNSPAIVFVPGWISLMAAWRDVLRELTKDFRIFYVETREKTTARVRGDGLYSVEAIARDIAAVVAHIYHDQEHYVLAGSSLGATAVIESCRFLEKKPDALVLIAPNTEFRVPALGLFIIKITTPYLYLLIKPVIKWYLRTFRLDLSTDYAQYAKYCSSLDAADPWRLKKAAIAFSTYQVWNALRSIPAPVLVFGASEDILHEPDNLKRMLSRLKNATFIDLGTNKRTHSIEMASHLRDHLGVSMKGEKR